MASEEHNLYGSASSISPANVNLGGPYGCSVYPTGSTSSSSALARGGANEASTASPTLSPLSGTANAGLGSPAQAMMATNKGSRIRNSNLPEEKQAGLMQIGSATPSAPNWASSQSNSQNLEQVAIEGGAGNIGQSSRLHYGSGHSVSYLANENYIAGMSSDSELTNSARGHHRRPYSSQSRVYHAHPAPRVNAAGPHTSSRLSHHSDSAGYAIQSKQMSTGSLSHQMSAGAELSVSPRLHQYQQQKHQQPATLGRQLPARPGFKQSMSIDQQSHQHLLGRHGSPGHYASPSLNTLQQFELSSGPQGTLGVAGGAPGTDMAQATPTQPHQHHHLHQRWMSTGVCPADVGRYSPSRKGLGHDLELVESQTANLSLFNSGELDRQLRAAGRDQSRQMPQAPSGAHLSSMSFDQHQTHQQHHQALQQHLRQQQSPINQHQSAAFEASQPSHQQQARHTRTQLELLGAHKVSSAASSAPSWLPPIGHQMQSQSQSQSPPQSHPQQLQHPLPLAQSSRPNQAAHFKQAASIDHYPQSGNHYSPVDYRTPSLAANFDEHYRPGYGALPASYYQRREATEEPLEYGGGGGTGDGQSRAAGDYQVHEFASSTAQAFDSSQVSQQAQPAMEPSSHLAGASALAGSSANGLQVNNNYNNLPPTSQQTRAGVATCQTSKLQHQFSSGSSGGGNSHSGSLKSSNLDLNKQTPPDGPQKGLSGAGNNNNSNSGSLVQSNMAAHQYPAHQSTFNATRHDHLHQSATHQRSAGPRRGQTVSAVSSLAGSLTALNEASDLSSSQATNSGFGGVYSANKRPVLRAASPSATFDQISAGSSPHQHPVHQRHHHHHHYTAGSKETGVASTRSESSTGLPNGGGSASSSSSLTKKSNSATQLSMTGTKKRLGFRKKQVTSFSVHRSEEVAPLEARHLVKQGSSVSEGDSSVSGDSSSRSWSNSNFKQPTSDELASMSFIDGLGKGQMISRQGLASPYLGDIQLSLCDRRGNLEVEVIRARNLQAKTNKILPLTYVKLYLVKNRKCMAKAKTTLSNKRTLDPLFQQQLTFHEDYHGCILQSIIWGNFGKMDKKNFMGIAQISIDDLELSDTVISWYKLFLPSSLQTLPSKSIRHTLLSNSTESFTNTNNS